MKTYIIPLAIIAMITALDVYLIFFLRDKPETVPSDAVSFTLPPGPAFQGPIPESIIGMESDLEIFNSPGYTRQQAQALSKDLVVETQYGDHSNSFSYISIRRNPDKTKPRRLKVVIDGEHMFCCPTKELGVLSCVGQSKANELNFKCQ